MLTFGHFIQNLYTQNFYNVSVTKINPIYFWLHIYQLSMPISWSFLYYKKSNIHDWQVTSFLLQYKPNTPPEKGVSNTYEYLGECTP